MRRWIGASSLLLALSLCFAAGCGDDDDWRCPNDCRGERPYCGPDGECVECVYDGNCRSGQHCDDEFECRGG